jgi:CBS domain-containing protein
MMTKPTNILDVLRTHAPFDLVPAAILETIGGTLAEKRYENGGIVLSRTSPPQNLMIVLDGKVDIRTESGVVASLVPHEAFPLEVLQSVADSQVAGCDYIANGDVHLLLIPAAAIARLRSASQAFNEFCVRRNLVYEQRSQPSADTGGSRSGLNFELASILPAHGVATCPPETTIREVVQVLHQSRAGVIALTAGQNPVGIFTHGDLISRVLVPELSFDTPVAEVMTTEPVTLASTERGFDALVAMSRFGVRYIIVADQNGHFKGVISDRDLLHAQQGSSDLRQLIANAESSDDLVGVAARIRELAIKLVSEGIEAGHLTRQVSTLNDRLAERIVEIEAKRAAIPIDSFCWIALGSEGRHEQTLHTDQDNGLVFSCDDPQALEEKRRQMITFAGKVNEILDRCGFPLCSGNVMASNPECCLTPAEWQQRFTQWIKVPTPEALLNATIYFDMRPLCGNRALCGGLVDWLAAAVPNNKLFFHLLTENALQRRPPIGLFRDFVVDKIDGCFDIKLHGLALLVDGARILGLAAGSHSSATAERFRNAAEKKLSTSANLINSIAAFDLMQKIRLRHHNAQFARGEAANNRINPYALNNIDRKALLESLRHASNLQKSISTTFNLASRM